MPRQANGGGQCRAVLECLLLGASRQVFLILDNLCVHLSCMLNGWIEERREAIAPFPHSPGLNPDEHLNAGLKQGVGRRVTKRTKAAVRVAATGREFLPEICLDKRQGIYETSFIQSEEEKERAHLMSKTNYGPTVVYHGRQDVRIGQMNEMPQVEGSEVLVKVEACAICGTDVKSYFKGNHRLRPPVIIGHEFCGTIVETGRDVEDYSVEQRVTMATTIGCGECIYCDMGKSNLCKSAVAIGFQYSGAMAPYLRIPANAVKHGHLVDVGGLDAELAALSEPLSCVLNSLGRVPVGSDVKNIVVIGAGAIGLLHAIAAKAMGAERICCVVRPGPKAAIAAGLPGVTVVAPGDFDDGYLDLSGGEGFDLVAVTAPDNEVQAKSPMYARKGGYVSFFSSLPVPDHMLSVNSRTIHYNEVMVYGTSDSTPVHVQEAVRLLQGHPEIFRKLITHRMPMSQFGNAMDEIGAKKAAKIVLLPELG